MVYRTLKGEVEGLGGEVADDVGEVAAPEGRAALGGEGAPRAFHDARVRLIETALFDHFILILNQQFYALNRGRGRLK